MCYYTFLLDIADRKGDATLPTQHRSPYPCTSPTAKIFAWVPPNSKFQQFHKFRSCKRKLLNTIVTSFCRRATHRNCSNPHRSQSAVHSSRSQHTAMDPQPHTSCLQTTCPVTTELRKLSTQASIPNDSQKFPDHPSDHLGGCKTPL